jgi:hypothetical protein
MRLRVTHLNISVLVRWRITPTACVDRWHLVSETSHTTLSASCSFASPLGRTPMATSGSVGNGSQPSLQSPVVYSRTCDLLPRTDNGLEKTNICPLNSTPPQDVNQNGTHFSVLSLLRPYTKARQLTLSLLTQSERNPYNIAAIHHLVLFHTGWM